MSENRFWFVIDKGKLEYVQDNVTGEKITVSELEDLLNEQQELIEELQASDEMGWKRAEMFEKKCPKELHNKKMYIKRLEYKVQKFKEENEQLQKYNEQLKERLEKINGGYGHLTHRNGLTANEWLIESQERELKKKNEQISDWIERHSNDIVKIGEQQATIKSKDKQLERLYNYFQDYLKDEMSGNAFSEMWDFVKEDERWNDE